MYMAKRNYRREGVLIPRGTPLPELDNLPPAVVDRLVRNEFVERAPTVVVKSEPAPAPAPASAPLRGRPPVQQG